MKITQEMLADMGACEDHVRLFSRTFPRGAAVTLGNIEKARAAGLDLSWLARNSSTPPEVLAVLSNDTDDKVRYSVAGNSSTPLEVLAVLSTDTDTVVRRAVVGNSST